MEIRRIESPTNQRVIQATKLHKKKGREELGRFIAEGVRLAEMAESYAEVDYVFVTEKCMAGERADTLVKRFLDKEVPVFVVSENILRKVIMEFILDILYVYVAIYSIYFLALALRNLKDKPFKIEKRYSLYEEKDNLAIIIYSHNNKDSLKALVEQIKQQNYPIDCIKVFAILDNCNDGSEIIFNNNRFVNVINYDRETLGKDQAVSLLLEQLGQDAWIDSYVFIDANRSIPADFLSTVNSALIRNSVLSGETLMLTDNLDIIDRIKAVYQKYHMNFIRQARSLFGFAAQADSGVFIIKKEIVDQIGAVDFKDINSELKYSLLLSKIGCRCTYNPNIQTFVNAEGYVFRRPRLSKRLHLFAQFIFK